jgi:hypothetical protein
VGHKYSTWDCLTAQKVDEELNISSKIALMNGNLFVDTFSLDGDINCIKIYD